MRITKVKLKYNPTKVPPTWFGMIPEGPHEHMLIVSKQAYDFYKRVTDDYPLVPIGEFAALIEHTRISWEQFRYSNLKPELSKRLEKGDTIEMIKVKTSKGEKMIEIDNPEIIEFIRQKYTPPKLRHDPFNKLFSELWTYFDYAVGLRKYETPVLIGFIFAYCGVYKDRPLQTEPEFEVNPATNHPTYKAYLKNNVRSWINTINKNTGFND